MKLICLILSIFLLQVVYTQNHFSKIYTGDGYDYGEGVTQATDSTFFITGSSSSFHNSPSDQFILHVDTGGNYLWSKSYGSTGIDIGKRIFHIPNEGIYVAGFSNSYTNGLFDFTLLKTDIAGNESWTKTYGGTSNELVNDALMLPDTSFILIGQSTSNTEEIEDIYLIRISKTGRLLWTKTFGGSGVDIGRSISSLSINNYIIAGEFYDSDSLLTKGFVGSIDSLGNLNWAHNLGLKHKKYVINDLSVDAHYIRGVGYSQTTTNPNKIYYSFTLDTLGTDYSENDIIQPGSNYFSQIVGYGPFGYNYISMQPTDNTIIPTYSNGEDLIICRYKNDLTWYPKCVNPSDHGNDHCNQLLATNDWGVVSVGYNVSGGKGGSNITLLKIGPFDQFPTTSIPPVEQTLVGLQKNISNLTFDIYPNPVSEEITITINTEVPNRLEILSINGLLLEEKEIIGTLKTNISHLKSGVYFVKVGEVTKKFIVL
jgi:hypothetical protein